MKQNGSRFLFGIPYWKKLGWQSVSNVQSVTVICLKSANEIC